MRVNLSKHQYRSNRFYGDRERLALYVPQQGSAFARGESSGMAAQKRWPMPEQQLHLDMQAPKGLQNEIENNTG